MKLTSNTDWQEEQRSWPCLKGWNTSNVSFNNMAPVFFNIVCIRARTVANCIVMKISFWFFHLIPIAAIEVHFLTTAACCVGWGFCFCRCSFCCCCSFWTSCWISFWTGCWSSLWTGVFCGLISLVLDDCVKYSNGIVNSSIVFSEDNCETCQQYCNFLVIH